MLSEIQKQNRKKGLGGSDISAIVGCHPTKSATQLYLEKIGQAKEEEDNLRLRFGREAEQFVINEYNKETGKRARPFIRTIFDDDHSCLIANIDALNEDDCVVEAKTAAYSKKWGEEGTCEIPDYYLCQVAHYVSILNCEYADIPVLFLKNSSLDFKIYRYTRSEKLEILLRSKALEFWTKVISRIPPKPTSSADIELLYRGDGDAIKADNETILAVEELREVKEAIRLSKEKEKKLKDKIAVYMGDSCLLENDTNVILTYKSYESPEKVDKKRFQKECPEIAKKYMVQGKNYRKMLIK